MKKIVQRIIGLLLLFGLCGWAKEDKEPGTRKGDLISKEILWENPEKLKDPKIQAGHVVRVELIASGEKEEENDKRVSHVGTITLPLIGEVEVEGMTLSELAKSLEKKYLAYVKEPTVDTSFVIDESPGAVSPWGFVTVMGRVEDPGRINIPPTQDMTLSMAIQQAGGLATSSRETAIKVTRKDNKGAPVTKIFDLKSAAEGGKIEHDILLKGGDIVYVPERVF